MKFEEYINYCDFFSGREDSYFENKFVIDNQSLTTPKQAFNLIETFGARPLISQESALILLGNKQKYCAINNTTTRLPRNNHGQE